MDISVGDVTEPFWEDSIGGNEERPSSKWMHPGWMRLEGEVWDKNLSEALKCYGIVLKLTCDTSGF